MRAIVTAGGSAEPIDDVRVLGNRSTGRLAFALTEALAEHGVAVTLLTSAPAPVTIPAEIRTWKTADDLDRELALAFADGPVDWLFMAAAVADYRPERTAGKRRSDEETVTVTLHRRAKILPTLRQRLGPSCKIVGFKLLSGSDTTTLDKAARAQLAQAQVDWVVANDHGNLTDDRHPVRIVSPSDVVALDGARTAVAHQIIDHIVGPGWVGPAMTPLPDGRSHLRGPVFNLTRVASVQDASVDRKLRALHGKGPRDLAVPDGAILHNAPTVRASDGTHPVCSDGKVVGWIDPTTWAASIDPKHQGKGYGTSLAEWLDARGRVVHRPDVLPFLTQRGWTHKHGAHLPPSRRTDLHEAGSACVIDLSKGAVLLTRRPSGALAFPGGAVEPDESPVDAMRRELYEETGLVVDSAPVGRFVAYAADRGKAWRIHCGAWVVDHAPNPTGGLWVELPRVSATPGVLPGVRRVLRSLLS